MFLRNGPVRKVQRYEMSIFANNDRLQFTLKILFDDLRCFGCMLHCHIG